MKISLYLSSGCATKPLKQLKTKKLSCSDNKCTQTLCTEPDRLEFRTGARMDSTMSPFFQVSEPE